jgi:hypothetical protein
MSLNQTVSTLRLRTGQVLNVASLPSTYDPADTGKFFRVITDPAFLYYANGTAYIRIGTAQLGANGNTPDTSYNNILPVAEGDSFTQVTVQVDQVFRKLAPPQAPLLSERILDMAGGFSGNESTTGNSVTKIFIQGSLPNATLNGGFRVRANQYLTALFEGGNNGQIQIPTGYTNTPLTNLRLTISTIRDPNGSGGSVPDSRQNFWQEAVAFITTNGITGATAQVNPYELKLVLSADSNLSQVLSQTAPFQFRVDTIPTGLQASFQAGPTIVGTPISEVVDGVPTLNVGTQFTLTARAQNAVGNFYNPQILTITSPIATDLNTPVTGPRSGNVDRTYTSTIDNNSVYSEYTTGIVWTATARNIAGNTSTANISYLGRVDTKSINAKNSSAIGGRRRAGSSGLYPTNINITTAYDWSALLTTNYELQLIDGEFQYPPSIDYRDNLPTAGPNYTSLPPDASGFRWASFLLGGVNGSGATIKINGLTGVSSITDNSIRIYVKLYCSEFPDGVSPWFSANDLFPGEFNNGDITNPANGNGFGILLGTGNGSTITNRVLNFGRYLEITNILVRIGFPSVNKKFTSVSY